MRVGVYCRVCKMMRLKSTGIFHKFIEPRYRFQGNEDQTRFLAKTFVALVFGVNGYYFFQQQQGLDGNESKRQNVRALSPSIASTASSSSLSSTANSSSSTATTIARKLYPYVILGSGTTAHAALETLRLNDTKSEILMITSTSEGTLLPRMDASNSQQDQFEANSVLEHRLRDSYDEWRRQLNNALGEITEQVSLVRAPQVKIDVEDVRESILGIGVNNPEILMSKIKLLCRNDPNEAPSLICEILLKHHMLEGQTSIEREKALQCATQLFTRSAKFRHCICASMRVILDTAFAANLPGPNPDGLKAYATQVLQEWNSSFGRFHPQIALALQSEKLPLESQVEQSSSEILQQNVDLTRVRQILRGFKIVDGAPLTGEGEDEANLILLASEKVKETDTCLQLLLPFLQSHEYEALSDSSDRYEDAMVNEGNDVDQESDEEIEWEEDDFQNELKRTTDESKGSSNLNLNSTLESVYIPDGYTLDLTSSSNSDRSLQDVKEALLDCRLTMERIIVPELRLWSDSLERVVSQSSTQIADTITLQSLLRIKRLLQELQIAIERCDRMQIKPQGRKKFIVKPTKQTNANKKSRVSVPSMHRSSKRIKN